jgi:hypothetical protein
LSYFQGKSIPSIVRRSASGGITPEILVEVLQHYDKHVPRKAGDPPPAAILDGHGSRLSIEFLRYVNNLDRNGDAVVGANHEWNNIYLGLPHATAYWQVGDASEQNGAWKNLQAGSLSNLLFQNMPRRCAIPRDSPKFFKFLESKLHGYRSI